MAEAFGAVANPTQTDTLMMRIVCETFHRTLNGTEKTVLLRESGSKQ
jgi:hypothetical protein